MEITRLATLSVLFIVAATLVVNAYSNSEHTYDSPYPASFQVPYDRIDMCVMVKSLPAGPTCERQGFLQCAENNVGFCYQECVRRVINFCNSRTPMPANALSAGFEDMFRTQFECFDYVDLACGNDNDCNRRGKMRCQKIGYDKV